MSVDPLDARDQRGDSDTGRDPHVFMEAKLLVLSITFDHFSWKLLNISSNSFRQEQGRVLGVYQFDARDQRG